MAIAKNADKFHTLLESCIEAGYDLIDYEQIDNLCSGVCETASALSEVTKDLCSAVKDLAVAIV